MSKRDIIKNELLVALRRTRTEPEGLLLKMIAEVIHKILADEEIEVLILELENLIIKKS